MKSCIYALVLCLLLCIGAAPSVQAEVLKAPFSVPVPPAGKGKLKACASAPAPIIDLYYKSIYEETDPTASTVNPRAEAKYKADIGPLHAYETEIAKRANSYIRSEGRDFNSAFCALEWLSAWADAKALTGHATPQGVSVRKWSLASLSSAYLQIANDRRLNSKKKVAIKRWLYELSKLVIADYSRNPDSSSRRNNHVYWAAWAVGITSVAIQHRDHFDWAMDKAKIGLIQIEDDGTLPLEVRRSKRAQLYHLFATIPLVMLAELGKDNGVDLYGYNRGALHRLVRLNIMQMTNSDYIRHRAGEKQTLPKENMDLLLSWIEPYNSRFGFNDPELASEVATLRRKYQPFFNRRIGGDAVLLYGEPVPRRTKKQ